MNENNGLTKIPQKHGGALNPGGTKGNRGGPGRPPNAVREALRQHGWAFVQAGAAVAKDASHPKWFDYGKFAVEMTEGKPVQAIDAKVQAVIEVSVGLGLRSE